MTIHRRRRGQQSHESGKGAEHRDGEEYEPKSSERSVLGVYGQLTYARDGAGPPLRSLCHSPRAHLSPLPSLLLLNLGVGVIAKSTACYMCASGSKLCEWFQSVRVVPRPEPEEQIEGGGGGGVVRVGVRGA